MFILNTKIDVFNRNFDASPTRIVLKSKDGIGMAIYYLLTHIVLKKSHYAVLQKINDEDTEKYVYSISREKNGEVAFDFVKEEKIKKQYLLNVIL